MIDARENHRSHQARPEYYSRDGGDHSAEEILRGVKSIWEMFKYEVGIQLDSGGFQALCERGVKQHTVGGCVHIFTICF